MALSYHHVTVAGAGDGTGSSWANAMSEAQFEADLEGSAAGDDVYFVQAGTYTLDSAYDSSARDGTATAPIVIIGVKAATTNEGANVVYADWGSGTDRPLFSASTYAIAFGDYYKVFNCKFSGSGSPSLVTAGGYGVFFNCYFDQSYTSSAVRYCLNVGSNSSIISCEFTSSKCRGVAGNQYTRLVFCYLHDMTDTTNGIAFSTGSVGNAMLFNVFDNNYVCVLGTADTGETILNNTFYGGATGVSTTTDSGLCAINNIFEGMSADAVIQTTRTDGNFWWQNHGSDARCGDMWDGVDDTTVHKDYAATSGDPVFTTAGSNFSLQSTSPNLNAGLSISLGVG